MERKSRYWALLLYEESMPKNYIDIINEWYLPVCISPLHNLDQYEHDIVDEEGKIINKKGDFKKPHYHVLLCFGNSTTYKTALSYAQELGCKIVKPISSSRGAYEYWTHKNNPEKAQYNEENMQTFGGFKKEEHIGYTTDEIAEKIQFIIDIVNANNFKELKEIYDFTNKEGLADLRNLIQGRTLFIKEYVKSRKFMIDESKKEMIELKQGNI